MEVQRVLSEVRSITSGNRMLLVLFFVLASCGKGFDLWRTKYWIFTPVNSCNLILKKYCLEGVWLHPVWQKFTDELEQRAASVFRLAEYCYEKVCSRCILINLSDNNQWPLPVCSFLVIMEFAHPTAHTHGRIAAEVINEVWQIQKGHRSISVVLISQKSPPLRISKLYTV